jgi:flagellar biosynthesis/type III secretory pathway M-ring protein FliF/YscJ
VELILKPLENVNDPVWSVIILLCCGLIFTLYCVIYILRLSFKELEEDGQVREQGQERSIEAESRERDC